MCRLSILKSQSGVSAVEFALVAPLLFMLTFGIIEFGLLLFDKAVITNASREGARAAVVYSDPLIDDAAIVDVVTRYANGRLINLGVGGDNTLSAEDITIVPSEADRESGDYLSVTVRFTYDFLVLPDISRLVGGSFRGNLPLDTTTVMRME